MEIELIPIADLLPYANNARTHSPEQVQQIAASIREFGWTNPVLIDQKNGIIAGHGRALAAEKVGMTEVPCIRLGHLTETQRRAYVIADNQLALNSGWNENLLSKEIEALINDNFNIELTGFDLEDFEKKSVIITELDTAKPPDLGWILIKVPLEHFGKVQAIMDQLPSCAETFSTYTDDKENRQPQS